MIVSLCPPSNTADSLFSHLIALLTPQQAQLSCSTLKVAWERSQSAGHVKPFRPTEERRPVIHWAGPDELGNLTIVQLADIRIYPVKSTAGVGVDAATVEPWGLDGDRRWAVVAENGQIHSAREVPRMLSVTATPAPGGAVRLTAPGLPPIEVTPPVGGTPAPLRITRLDQATAAGEEAHRWMTRALGLPSLLLWLEDPLRRAVGRSHGGRPGDTLTLQDTGPLLLASGSSLRRLDDWIAEGAVERGEEIPEPLSALRFRPNVMIEGAEPFAEDAWTRVRIGEVEFRVGEHCDRCTLTTVDPVTTVKGKEPIRTLARHRKWDGKTWFGIRLIPDGRGEIRVGDAVTPLDASGHR